MTKTWLIALVCTGLVSVGCAPTPEEGSGNGGESETDSETGSETDSTGGPTTTDSTTEGPTGTETDGTTVSPTTDEPTTEDPTTEDPTTEDPTTEDPTTEDPTTEDPTTEDPTDPTTEDPTTEDPTTEEPTTDGGACNDIYVEEFGAEEAVLTGDWDLINSQQAEEGQVAYWPEGAVDGTVTWTYNVPCADDWHVWTRMYDAGSNDSFYVLVDGEPEGWAVTEVHCYNGGEFYRWGELNWRDPEANGCDYIEDPWVQTWDAGPHELVFAFRESPAISRLIFTNDPNFTP